MFYFKSFYFFAYSTGKGETLLI